MNSISLFFFPQKAKNDLVFTMHQKCTVKPKFTSRRMQDPEWLNLQGFEGGCPAGGKEWLSPLRGHLGTENLH